MKVVLLLATLALPAVAQQNCTFTLNPVSRSVPASPDTVGNITVTASASSCTRTAVSSNPDWLTISLGTVGTGNGTVGYRVDSNDTPDARTATITVGNARFTVTQAARNCTFDLSALSARVTYQAGRGNFRVTTDCRWTASSSAGWLRITQSATSGSANVDYVFDENPSTDARTATITIGARQFTLTQAGAPCTFRLSPAELDIPPGGGSGSITVQSTCAWTAASAQTWITVSTTRDAIAYQVAANPFPQARIGAITAAGQTVAVRQGAAVDVPVISAIANGASYTRNFASPGAILVLKGSRFAAAKILFDGAEAPVISATDEIAWVNVPYEVAGKSMVRVVAEAAAKRSAEYTLPVTPTAPGVFTRFGTGTGNALAWNEDLTLNSPASPAARGSTIRIYATGEGVTESDADAVQRPTAQVQLFLGGAAARVIAARAAAGGTTGLVEIEAIVPLATQPGDVVTVDLRIGGRIAQENVTIAIR